MVEDLKKFWMVSRLLSLLLMMGFHKALFLVQPFLLFINDLPVIVLLKIAVYADDTTLYCRYDKASGMWKQVVISSGLESDLRDTVEWGNRWIVSFSARKTQLVSFDQSSNSGVTDIKMDKAVLGREVIIPFVRSIIYF